MKLRIKPLILTLALLMLTLPSQAKKSNYHITLKIEGGIDSVMFMGHYHGKGNRVVDTAYLDKKGCFVFESSTRTLPEGLYFFANNKGNYVEFVVYKEKPFFSFETKQGDWTSNMQTKGSKQNEQFFLFHRIQGESYADLDKHESTMDSASFKVYVNQKLRSLDSIRRDFCDNHPELFLSKMMNATKEIVPPLVNANGDSLTMGQRREYYLEHYFDNIPLDDETIIRTPRKIFYERVINYFDNVLKYAPPEQIIQYMDPLIDKSKAAPEIFQFLVLTLTQKYLQSNVMVYDEIYVHLVQKYFASEDNFWSAPSSIEKESLRAAKWERLLVGKEAPELILYDTLRVPHSLHATPGKWKLLIFWSPSCGHCQHIIPAVYKVFEQYRDEYDLTAFTILSEPDDKNRKEWREFMQKHGMNHPAWISLDGGEANVDWHDVYDITSTPQIYLIDENNIIQAKKLGEGTTEDILKAICGQGK